MSAKYTFWAWKQKTGSHTAKIVLLKLADAANDEGESWYSIPKMLVVCEMSDRAFRSQLRRLEELGLLTTHQRDNRSSVYALKADWEGVELKKVEDRELFGAASGAGLEAKDSFSPAPDAGTPAPDADDLNSVPINKITSSSSPLNDDAADKGDEAKEDRVPLKAIIDLYHEKLPEWPHIRVKPAGLDRQLRARWKSKEFDLGSLERWGKLFDHVRKSDFLMGRKDNVNSRHANWRPDLLWLTKPSSINKLIEGNYHAN